jgi:sigma-B regulation protein RsbU (phosphoserine phosphatase)
MTDFRARQTDHSMQSIVDYVIEGVVTIDESGHILSFNPAAERMFGYGVADVVGKNVASLLSAESLGGHQPEIEGSRTAGTKRVSGDVQETMGLRSNGSTFPVEISMAILPGSDDRRITVVFRDTTEQRQLESIRHEQRIAADIQRRMVPRELLSIPGFSSAARLINCSDVGGDFYDVIGAPDKTSESVVLVMADVAGHGVSSGIVMAATAAYLRAVADFFPEPSKLLRETNRFHLGGAGSVLITAIVAKLTPKTRQVSWASAGHCPGYLISADGQLVMQLEADGHPMGIVPDCDFPRGKSFLMMPGDILCLYTDGIAEARSVHNEIFGYERLTNLLQVHCRESPQGILDALFATVDAFCEGAPRRDDQACLIVRCEV